MKTDKSVVYTQYKFISEKIKRLQITYFIYAGTKSVPNFNIEHVVDIACLNVDELHPRDESIEKTINQGYGNSLLTKDFV